MRNLTYRRDNQIEIVNAEARSRWYDEKLGEPQQWFTTDTGRHVPLYKGDDYASAMQRQGIKPGKENPTRNPHAAHIPEKQFNEDQSRKDMGRILDTWNKDSWGVERDAELSQILSDVEKDYKDGVKPTKIAEYVARQQKKAEDDYKVAKAFYEALDDPGETQGYDYSMMKDERRSREGEKKGAFLRVRALESLVERFQRNGLLKT